jgi:hypothetical protein
MNPSGTKLILISLFTLIILAGCKKDAGEGGTATITGKVIVHDFDQAFQQAAPTSIYPKADEKVYIIYGENHNTYDDDYNTSYDGSYEFKHLQKGNYRIFAYSKDTTGVKMNGGYISKPKVPVIINVEIKSSGETVTAPDIIILDNNN